MILRIYPGQLKPHWDLINEAIEASFPESQLEMKTKLLRDLMIEKAMVWGYEKDGEIKGIFIHRISEDYAVGRKTFTVVLAYGLDKLGPKIFAEGFRIARKIGKAENCDVLDFYSDNPIILEYARMFDVVWECTYMQLKF